MTITKGNRKLIWGMYGMSIVAAVSILSILFLNGDAGAITAAITTTGGVLTSFIATLVWGNRAEYSKPEEKAESNTKG